jgi:hypothetical protein
MFYGTREQDDISGKIRVLWFVCEITSQERISDQKREVEKIEVIALLLSSVAER